MSGAGGLDIRLPIGGLFVVLGLILVGYGVVTNADAAQYERSMSVNINLWWGLVMLGFGGLDAPAGEELEPGRLGAPGGRDA